MRLTKIFFAGMAIFMCACTPARRITTSNSAMPAEPSETLEQTKMLYPEGHPLYQRQSMPEIARIPAEVDESKYYVPRRPRKDRPTKVFPHEQTLYLQLVGVNPLPPSGVLELDLAAMAADFCYPYDGNVISRYGPRGNSYHTGLDIKAVPGDTIRAAFPGVVRMSKEYSGYGNIVVISHYQGFETVYSHGVKNLVRVNDVVEPGDPIALAGRTGHATTEHLHFEVRAGDAHLDPENLLDADARKLRDGKLYVTTKNGNLVAYTNAAELESVGAQQPQQIAVADQEVKPVTNVRTGAAAEAPGQAVYYNVKSGDTLSAIARRYSTTVTKLCQLNNIKPTSLLQINQRLRVK